MPGNQGTRNPEVTATLIEASNILEKLVQNGLLNTPDKYRKDRVSTEHAFDYDGCTGNDQHGKKTPEELVKAEADFWAYVKRIMRAETKGLPKNRRCVSIATARQSKEDDDNCTEYNDSTSCFPLYSYIAKYLDAKIDKFLLADAKKQLPTGTSFDRAMNPKYEGEHADWYFDESKITLIYAKVHRSALCNPNGLALFTFYDDRKDILDALHAFFTENINLLPHNLVLNLCLYVKGSGVVRSYEAISGIQNSKSLGIDYRYKQTATTVGAYIHSLAKDDGTYRVPIGIDDIKELKLGRFIYRLRKSPSAEEEVESAERQLRPRIGQMIFKSANEADHALGVTEADQNFTRGC